MRTSLAAASAVFSLFLSGATPGLAVTINVCPSGCTYSTIQAGIDAANYADTVLVAPGTYTGGIVFFGKEITLQSSGGAAVTTIQGGAPVVKFDSGSGSSVIDGFTITGGNNVAGSGGGIHSGPATPTIRNCWIAGNTTTLDGGGIYATGATIANCAVHGNTASRNGGGIYNIRGVVSNSTIYDNSAEHGGGIYNFGSCQVSGCDVHNNVGFQGGYPAGGGIYSSHDYYADPDAAVTISNCTISENSPSGIGSTVTSNILNCVIRDQQLEGTSLKGGGVHNNGNMTMENCTITGNGEGVVSLHGIVNINSCTISNNSVGVILWNCLPGSISGSSISNNGRGGIRAGDAPFTVYVSDCVISGNHGTGGILAGGTGTGNNVQVSGCDISGNVADYVAPDWSGNGGGIGNTSSSSTTISVYDSIVQDNSAVGNGGGVYKVDVVRSLITGNVAAGNGGGAHSSNLYNSTITGNVAGLPSPPPPGAAPGLEPSGNGGGAHSSNLYNSTITGNKATSYGGGIFNSPQFNFCTISGNLAVVRGGGVAAADSTTTGTNSIIWGNADEAVGTSYDQVSLSNAVFNLTYTDIQNGWQGVGNFIADPLFVTPVAASLAPTSAGDYHIQNGSPCIDAAAAPYLATDIDGEARPFGGGGDVGSDEYWPARQTATYASAGSSDGWVLESSEISNRGGTLSATGTTLRVGDDAANKQYRSILSFSTAVLPDNAVILSATLKVRYQGKAGTTPFTTHGKLLVDAMRGSFLNNAALQLGDFEAVATKAGAATIGSTPVAGWHTTLIPGTYVNRTGNTQLRLRFAKDDNNDRSADYVSFHSGNAVAASRPVLVIVYYTP